MVLVIVSLCLSSTPQATELPSTTPAPTAPPTTASTTTPAPDNLPNISGYNTDVIEKQVGDYELTFSSQPIQVELSVSATDDNGPNDLY